LEFTRKKVPVKNLAPDISLETLLAAFLESKIFGLSVPFPNALVTFCSSKIGDNM
jgi:hypothetical protein